MKNRDAGFAELAIPCFSKAINLVSNNYLFYAQRGFSRRDLMRFEEALVDLDQAVRLCEQQNLSPHYSLLFDFPSINCLRSPFDTLDPILF